MSLASKMIVALFYLAMALIADATPAGPTPPPGRRLESRQDQNLSPPPTIIGEEDKVKDAAAQVLVGPDLDTAITGGDYSPEDALPVGRQSGAIQSPSLVRATWTESELNAAQTRGELPLVYPFTWWIYEPGSDFSKLIYYLDTYVQVPASWRGNASFTISTKAPLYNLVPPGQDIPKEDVQLVYSEPHCLDEQLCEQYPWPFTQE
ncbi:hypothetical protein IAT40_005534 [Kwoniella sp. CBS 6097]